jgi:twinkle protein
MDTNSTTISAATHPAERAFSARGLDWQLADKLGATYVPGKFLYQYRKAGKLLFTKVRTDDKQFWIEPSGAKLHLWGLDEVSVLPERPREPLVITEGEPDRIACMMAGAKYALSVPNGSSGRRTEGTKSIAEDTGFAYLWGRDERLIPEVEQFDKIILFTDADEKGIILRDELALRIGEHRCWYIPYPENTKFKDANDILKVWGVETLRRALAAAKPMRPGNLLAPDEIPPQQHQKVYETGWSWLDKRMKLVRPELVIVTGIPGHGKGLWTRALCCNLAFRHGLRAALLTPEDPPHRVKRDLYRFALHKFSTPTRYDPDKAKGWVNQHFRISRPREDDSLTIDYVEAEMASAALHHNCQIFVADPWNELAHDFGTLTETQYVERTLVRLKKAARRYGLILILVAHPRKTEGEPDLYAISGSANWKNKADHGVIVHRLENPTVDDVEPEELLSSVGYVILEKCKDHETMGTPGRVLVKFDEARCDYVVADRRIEPANPVPEQRPNDEIPF